MTSSSDLFLLIKSLTPQEKRWFKIAACKNLKEGKIDYTRLFSIIEKQPIYDEEKIKQLLKREKFIKHLPVVKNRLFHLILNITNEHEPNSTSEKVLQKELQKADLLYQKGLYAQSKKILEKNKKSALHLEQYNIVFEILTSEIRMVSSIAYSDIKKRELRALFKEGKDALIKMENFYAYKNLEVQILYFQRYSDKIRAKGMSKEHNSIFKNSLLDNEKKALTTRSKIVFNTIHGAYNHFIYNYPKAYRHIKRNIEMLESNSQLIEENPNVYSSVLYNFITSCISIQKFEDGLRAIKKLRTISDYYKIKPSLKLLQRQHLLSYIPEIRIYAVSGQFEKIKAIVENIEDGIKKYGGKADIDHEKILYYNIAYLYFGIKEYRNSLKWLSKLSDAVYFDVRDDLNTYAKLMTAVIYIELNDIQALTYLIESTHRSLNKKDKLYMVEAAFFQLAKKIPQMQTRKDLINLYMITKNNIQRIVDDPIQKNGFAYFDFSLWLKSKIESRVFAEVVRENYQNRWSGKQKLPDQRNGSFS